MKFFVALAMISTVAAQRTITVGVLYSFGSELTCRPCTSGLQRVPVHDVVIYVDYQGFSIKISYQAGGMMRTIWSDTQEITNIFVALHFCWRSARSGNRVRRTRPVNHDHGLIT
jgi:hypothetical protein